MSIPYFNYFTLVKYIQQQQDRYYRCSYCWHVGYAYTSLVWVPCGGCSRKVNVVVDWIGEGEYKRVWGVSFSTKTNDS